MCRKNYVIFYDMCYYSGNMKVVIVGAYALDELQNVVEISFKDVSDQPRLYSSLDMRRTKPNAWDEICYSPLEKFGLPFSSTETKSSSSSLMKL